MIIEVHPSNRAGVGQTGATGTLRDCSDYTYMAYYAEEDYHTPRCIQYADIYYYVTADYYRL